MKRFMGLAIAFIATGAIGMPAHAQEDATTVTGDLPRTMGAPIRVLPVVGASSFSTEDDLDTDNFDNGFSAGLFVDFGSRFWTFETGILSLQSRGISAGNTSTVNVDSWGIPLLAKLNFSGKPHETVFLKGGAMPFQTGGDVQDTDVMGVAGVGGALPIGRNSSFQLDATYNRAFSSGGEVTDFQGVAILAGLAFNM